MKIVFYDDRIDYECFIQEILKWPWDISILPIACT